MAKQTSPNVVQIEDTYVPLPERFEEIARRYAGLEAVRSSQSHCSFEELDQQSLRLARCLCRILGKEPRPVALLLEEKTQIITSLLGVIDLNADDNRPLRPRYITRHGAIRRAPPNQSRPYSPWPAIHTAPPPCSQPPAAPLRNPVRGRSQSLTSGFRKHCNPSLQNRFTSPGSAASAANRVWRTVSCLALLRSRAP